MPVFVKLCTLALLLLVAASLASARVTPEELGVHTSMVPMRDGVRLATDVYVPAGGKPAPVLLMRTPYSRRWPVAGVRNLRAAGYAVVLQDMRGRFTSEGANIPFDSDGWLEQRDGYDTLNWIAAQPWCNGKIGMYGGSAMGIAQVLAACSGTRQLSCLSIAWDMPNLYGFPYTNGGLFRQSIVEGWLKENEFPPQVLQTWAAHPTYDAYWRQRDATRRFARVDVPATHVGGWYDLFSQGTIDAFVGFQTQGGAKARGKQKLLMAPGPAPHTDEVQPEEITFPHADDTPSYVAGDHPWFAHYLQGANNGVEQKTPAVTYFVMGDVTDPAAPGNCWRTATSWPPVKTQPTPLYLQHDGMLGAENNASGQPLAYDYDPRNPVPTIGGPQYFLLAGPRDQRSIESRPDVLVFTGAPLKTPLEITGRVRAQLWASTNTPDTDFFVRLCDVYPDGRSIIICEGGRRARLRDTLSHEEPVQPGKPYRFAIDMWSTSIILNKGHRLRVHVTSSCSPGYIANANTGAYPYSTTSRVAHNTIYLDKRHPSYVVLPVAGKMGTDTYFAR
jgi:predicted acyl esterase